MPKIKLDLQKSISSPIEVCNFDTFLEAIKIGDVAAIESLYFTDEHLIIKNDEGLTALHLAVIAQKEAMVRWLLLQGAVVDEASSNYQWTALHFAAQNNSELIVRNLLLAGADSSARTHEGWTPLHIAIKNENVSIMKLLILNCPDSVNYPDNKSKYPIHFAVESKNSACLNMLIKERASLEVETDEKKTAFDIASEQQHEEVLDILNQAQERHDLEYHFNALLNKVENLEQKSKQQQDNLTMKDLIIAKQKTTIKELTQKSSKLKQDTLSRIRLFESNTLYSLEMPEACNKESKLFSVKPHI